MNDAINPNGRERLSLVADAPWLRELVVAITYESAFQYIRRRDGLSARRLFFAVSLDEGAAAVARLALAVRDIDFDIYPERNAQAVRQTPRASGEKRVTVKLQVGMKPYRETAPIACGKTHRE